MSAGEGTDGADDGGDDGGPGRREVAHRVFAAEFDDATVSYRESDEERAPNYVVTPTGARVNRLFAVGVLTEVEPVNDDVVRARVADPTGVFVSYAGQYQPDPLAFFERTEPPVFVALTGKARTFEPDDGDRIYTSVRPESVNAVEAETRDRWVVSAAEATLDRVALFEEALAADERGDDLRERLRAAGHREALAAGIPVAIERYGTTPAYLEAVRRTAVEALELVAGERDAVDGIDLAPDEGGPASVGPAPDQSAADASAADAREAGGTDAGDAEPAATASGTGATDGQDGAGVDDGPATAAGTAPETEAGATASTGADPSADDGSSGVADGSAPSAATADDDGTGLGDFDGGSLGRADGTGDSPGGDADTETPDADEEGMYELDDEERREVREEYGTEFETGSEVDGPGEADIDVPAADESERGPESEAETKPESEEVPTTGDGTDEAPAGGGETAAEGLSGDAPGDGAATDDAEAEREVDLEDAAVAAMEDLDDGDGVDRESVVAAVVDEHGVDPEAAEDAIQDALMSGRCYEPAEGTLKPI